MDLEEAERLCGRQLIASSTLGTKLDLLGWDRAVRRFGQCRVDERRITLSRELVALNAVDLVRDTVPCTEIAHGLAPPAARVTAHVGVRSPQRSWSPAGNPLL